METQKEEKSVKLGRRIASGIIDVVFYTLVFSLISIIFTGKTDNLPDYSAWIPIALYVVVFHCYLNYTPGMKIMGYKFVNSRNLAKPSGLKLVLRWFIAFVLRFSAVFGIVALVTFKPESGFFWDRWFKIKVVSLDK